jgi:hypothetical protein
MATGFAQDIRPYFTACYRAHMIEYGNFDLWSAKDAQNDWQDIFDQVDAGNMPPAAGQPGACPEGGWDDLTRKQFLKDFQAWKDGGFQP